MEITWSGEVMVAVAPERAYAYLADLPRHAEWAQSVVRLELVRPGDAAGVGAVYRTAERQAWQTDRAPHAAPSRGVPGDTMCEVLELVPNRRVAWHSWAPVPGVRHEGWFSFEIEPAPGGARVVQTARLSDNWLGNIVSRLVFRTTPPKAHAQWEASLRNLKSILDASAAGRPASAPVVGGLYVA